MRVIYSLAGLLLFIGCIYAIGSWLIIKLIERSLVSDITHFNNNLFEELLRLLLKTIEYWLDGAGQSKKEADGYFSIAK